MLTYRQIKYVLDSMSREQLEQPAQVFMSQADGDVAVPLCPVIAFKKIKELVHEEDETRSSVDNEHHPEQFVFLADYNPFAEDGAIAYDLETGEAFYGNNKKKEGVENNEFDDTFPDEA